jgi:hypothetical protein
LLLKNENCGTSFPQIIMRAPRTASVRRQPKGSDLRARSCAASVNHIVRFSFNSFTGNLNLRIVCLSLDERRSRRARQKAAASASHGPTQGIKLRRQAWSDTRGMKGRRPSAIPEGSKPVRALQADVFLPDIGSIGLSLSTGSSGCNPGIRGRHGSLFRALAARGCQSSKLRPSVHDLKNGASPSLAS